MDVGLVGPPRRKSRSDHACRGRIHDNGTTGYSRPEADIQAHARMNDKTLRLEQATPEDGEDLTELRILAMRESIERIGRFDPSQRRVEDMAAKVNEAAAKPAPAGGCAL